MPASAGVAPAVVADLERLEREGGRRPRARRRGHRMPSPGATNGHATTATIATRISGRSQRSTGGSGTTRYAVRRPAGAEAARLEGERPLADVDERAEQDRPDERDEGPHAPAERAADLQAAGLLRLEDRRRALLEPRHHLDGREDHPGEAVAHAAGDERLEQVVRQRRLEERDRGDERDQHPSGGDEAEGESRPARARAGRAGR